jgi:hypothetical protein
MSDLHGLTDVEIRVLGVLIEKALTSPGAYPMTVNSIVVGCNQLQNRDPVVSYGESQVSSALRNLEHKALVAQAASSAGARSVRYEHRVVDRFHWDRREQAVMTELMLRGRQTSGELRTRASRMTDLPDLQAIVSVLDALRAHVPPFAEELPREPGRSANRFRHLLSAEAARPEVEKVTVARMSKEELSGTETISLEARVGRLEAEVAELKATLTREPRYNSQASEGQSV